MRELRSIFYSPVAFVVMTFLLVLLGWTFQYAVSELNRATTEYTVLERWFVSGLFFFILPITTSLVTMRSFSEEFRMGTIEMLTTAPVKDWQIVVAKFLGTFLFYAAAVAPSVLFFVVLSNESGGHPAAKGPGAIYSSYLMLMLVVMLFVSAGNLASSLTKDQVIAAVISITVKLLFLFVPVMMGLLLNTTDPRVRLLGEFISPLSHMNDAAAGIVDSRRIVWYLSLTVFFVTLTHHIFHSRKLKS